VVSIVTPSARIARAITCAGARARRAIRCGQYVCQNRVLQRRLELGGRNRTNLNSVLSTAWQTFFLTTDFAGFGHVYSRAVFGVWDEGAQATRALH
jgi:hypothetical protein